MDISSNEMERAQTVLSNMAKDLLSDRNLLSKSIAVYLRNQLENFHVRYLSDEQMKYLNPLIRNAIFSFLTDFGNDYASANNPKFIGMVAHYIIKGTSDFIHNQNLTNSAIKKFQSIIRRQIEIPCIDLSRGAQMLAGYAFFYVPEYWEDCVYIPNLND